MLCESSYDYEVPHRDWQLPLLLAAVGRWGVFPTGGSCSGQGNRGLAKCLKAMTVDRKEKNQTKQEEGVGGRK